ncbi:unnamed protein product [Dicrocoelium dendriticum]|nr:unnamed protein product [Dicrocoelium dendriticum]
MPIVYLMSSENFAVQFRTSIHLLDVPKTRFLFVFVLHILSYSSPTMLRPKALAETLKKVTTGGVQSVMLFNSEGVLLAFTSHLDDAERSKAAITANIWNIYQRHLESTESDTVQEILLELTEGRFIVCKVASLLLCLHSTKEVPLGMLRVKASSLVQTLNALTQEGDLMFSLFLSWPFSPLTGSQY